MRGRGGAVPGRAASRRVLAAARTPGHPAARVHPRRHDQDPDPVPSRHRPGAAAASAPLHQCGAAPVAARALERDPGRAPSFGVIAGCGCHASGLGGVAGGPDAALHLAAHLPPLRLLLVWDNLTATRRPTWCCGCANMASCRSTRLWPAAGSTWRSQSSACSSAACSMDSTRTAQTRSEPGLSRPRDAGMSSQPRLSGMANAGNGGADPVASRSIGSAALEPARTGP